MISYSKLLPFDIESYPNIFTITVKDNEKNVFMQWESSWRKNNLASFIEWVMYWKHNGFEMVGFNNIGYDYPVIHELLTNSYVTDHKALYDVSSNIINTPWESRWDNHIDKSDIIIPQHDLFLIHHFDNKAKRCSLKQVEFVMRMSDIQDLPYEPAVPIPETDFDADHLLFYNKHDVKATDDFTVESMEHIEFRRSLTQEYDKDFTNLNDTAVGKTYFQIELKKRGVKLWQNGQKRQTWRDFINLGHIVFDYVTFERPEFQMFLNEVKKTVIYETKGSFNHKVTLDGFEFSFGLGGIHGSVEGETIIEDDEFEIIDADVEGYYPALSIANNVYPEHLGDDFCAINDDLRSQRRIHEKGTVKNKAMKLAMNGVYGDTNSHFSVFYDPKYTMTITVNGQLLLCMLAEQLMKIPNLQMIQINTDGLTVKCPRKYRNHYDQVCSWWQQKTSLILEFVNYSKMAVRDVNNYLAVTTKGKRKLKGAFVHMGAHEGSKLSELDWSKNHSALVVKKAAVAAILDNVPVKQFITNHKDVMDFMLLAKVDRASALHLYDDIKWDGDIVYPNVPIRQLQRVSRYYVSNNGNKLIKSMKPLKRRTNNLKMTYPNWKGKKATGLNKHLKVSTEYEFQNALQLGYRIADGGTFEKGPTRLFEIEAGWLTTIVNKIEDDHVYDINYEYYINEAEKLVDAVKGIR